MHVTAASLICGGGQEGCKALFEAQVSTNDAHGASNAEDATVTVMGISRTTKKNTRLKAARTKKGDAESGSFEDT